MLIKALSDYYDILQQSGKVLPEGYSKVNIHYIIALSEDGKIDDIIDAQIASEKILKNGKIKQVKIPLECIMPKRSEKSGIEANILEHRPTYLFGLNFEENKFNPNDRTQKAKKSHQAFVSKTLEFIKNLDTPIIDAYRKFIENWNPEKEIENKFLLQVGKNYKNYGYSFCLSGSPDKLLHDDTDLKERWESFYFESKMQEKEAHIAQCAVTGNQTEIARIHGKIKGVAGGLSTGSVLIGFNNPSEESYGNKQSYNSNISEQIMKKYTESLNYLLQNNKIILDDMTIVFWAIDSSNTYENIFFNMLSGFSDGQNAEQTESLLKSIWDNVHSAGINKNYLAFIEEINPNVDFYVMGLKPNSSRLSLKFLIKKKYGDILENIVRFQEDMRLIDSPELTYLTTIKKELVSLKSTTEKVNPALLTKIFEAIIYGSKYPSALMTTMIRRVRIDNVSLNSTRTGVIKACINRNYTKGELKMSLDQENNSQAYLCGRLFAVLQKLQEDTAVHKLNRTIKDSYFSSAMTNPVLVFPKIIKLSQYYMKKTQYAATYKILIEEIIDKMQGEFLNRCNSKQQGEFIVGYYQQYKSFFVKKNKEEENK